MAFFSVVIPLHNKAAFVSKTLESVLNQTFDDFEIIIVNDGSTDDSINKVKAHNDKRLSIYENENQGVSVARNIGIEKSKANYICLLDADDLWKPNHLEDLKQLIEDFPNCGLYCKAYQKSFFNRNIIKSTYLDLEDGFYGIVPDFFYNSLIDCVAWTSAVAFPKKNIDRYGGFDKLLRSGQDTDFWIRVALNEKIVFSNKISATKVIAEKGDHLSLSDKRVDRIKILYKYKKEEESNSSFKKYMDLNRFSIALERKSSNDKIWKSIVKDINYDNLNWKQRLLLKVPKNLVKNMKIFQDFLIKNHIYLSPFK